MRIGRRRGGVVEWMSRFKDQSGCWLSCRSWASCLPTRPLAMCFCHLTRTCLSLLPCRPPLSQDRSPQPPACRRPSPARARARAAARAEIATIRFTPTPPLVCRACYRVLRSVSAKHSLWKPGACTRAVFVIVMWRPFDVLSLLN